MKIFSIIYEDDEILLINKEEGVSVQGGAGISHSLDEDLSKQLGYKIYLVHRLDKETAGILIVAKSSKAASKWTNLLSTNQVQKEYIALTVGNICVNGKSVKKGILKDKIEAHGRIQNASLEFSVEKEAEVEIITENPEEIKENLKINLVKVKLDTGRMHQIRIQLAKINSPIIADDKHGNFKLNKKLRKLGIKKLCLVSYKLTIPLKGKNYVFEIPLPKHIQSVIDTFFVK